MPSNVKPMSPSRTAAGPVVGATLAVSAVPIVKKQGPVVQPPQKKPQPPHSLQSVIKAQGVSHLIELYDDLRAAATTTEDRHQLISRFMDAVALRGKLIGSAWVEVSDDGEATIVESRFGNPSLNNQAMRGQLVKSAKTVVASPDSQVLKSERLRGSLFACVPFFLSESKVGVICAVVRDDKQRCTESLAVCQAVANSFEMWRSKDQLNSMGVEVRNAASVLELVGKVESSETFKAGCVEIANELQNYLRCDCVAVGLRKSNSASCRMRAFSLKAGFESQRRSKKIIQRAFDEAIRRGKYTSFPASPDDQTSPALFHEKLARQMQVETAITVPLRNQSKEVIGAITILGNRDLDGDPSTRSLINGLQLPLGSCLEVVKSNQGGWLRKLKQVLASKVMKWAALVLLSTSMVAMFLPVTYRVGATCTVEPMTRSFSVAPHGGLLKTSYVGPGDTVSQGQLLARMDGGEVKLQIAKVIAQINHVTAEQRSYLARGEINQSVEAELERDSLEAELKILQERSSNLEIRSMADGMVLDGSVDKRKDYPVTLGQTLYQIAPISPLRIELAIRSDEIINVAPQQEVEFRLDGFESRTFKGKIDKIQPRSSLDEAAPLLIAEVVLENENGNVRPGMKGSAKISGKKRTLGWSLFHQPWKKVATAIGF